jgi:ABC-type dipeptide/oligopeptide/nickel transport system permease component
MWGYIGRRLLATLPVLAVVSVLVFMMLRLTPGDPAAVIAGPAANSQDILDIREKLGGQGIAPGGGTAEAFASFVRDDYARWGRVVKESGVKVD